MSRLISNKNKADKSATKGANSAQVASATVHTNDLIPNRINLTDWTNLMQEEDDINFIGELVYEIIDKVLNKCYEEYINKQLMPYTLSQTKQTLLKMIQWHFLLHDTGEMDLYQNPQWQEESEPEPSVIDSWAQGSVPVIVNLHKEEYEDTNLVKNFHDDCQESEDGDDALMGLIESNKEDLIKLPEEKKEEKKAVVDEKDRHKITKKVIKKCSNTLKPKELSQSVTNSKLDSKVCRTSDLKLTRSQKSMIKTQNGRPPGNRDINYDESGNVTSVIKINVDSIPDYVIRTGFRIINPENEERGGIVESKYNRGQKREVKSNPTRRSHLLTKLTNKYSSIKSQQRISNMDDPSFNKMYSNLIAATNAARNLVSNTHLDPYTPALIEAIDASPGVLVREGYIVKKGPSEDALMMLGHKKNITKDRLLMNLKNTNELRLLSNNSPKIHEKIVLPKIEHRSISMLDN